MPSCKEVSRSIASDEVAELTLSGRLGVYVHLVRCRSCRLYGAQLRDIGTSVRSHYSEESDPDRLANLTVRITGALFDDTSPPA